MLPSKLKIDLPPDPGPVRYTCTNIYANKKNKRYSKIITEKELDLNYQSFIVETFGAFASDTWKFINTVCDPNTHPNANDEYKPVEQPRPTPRLYSRLRLRQPTWQRHNADSGQ